MLFVNFLYEQFPDTQKNKTVYFVKRQCAPVKKGSFKQMVMYGEISTLPLDQLISMVDTVSAGEWI